MDVFADVSCPFSHVGLRRFVDFRLELGRSEPVLRVRAWPLEVVNGVALDGPSLEPKIAALRADVARGLFLGFDPARFPATTLPALAAEAAAYRIGPETGQAFSLAVRHALFEAGRDIADVEVLDELRHAHGVPTPDERDHAGVLADLEEGRRREVAGSPHFFTPTGSFFCPSLNIAHRGHDYEVRFDADGFQRFVSAVFRARRSSSWM